MCGCTIRSGESREVFLDGARLTLCPYCYSKTYQGRTVLQQPQQSAPRIPTAQRPKTAGTNRQSTTPARPWSSEGGRRDYSDRLELAEDYAERIKRARESIGWDQKTLALKLKVGENVVKRIEGGKLRPTIDLAKRIEEVLGIKILVPAIEDVIEGNKIQKHATLGEVVKIRGVDE